jgi:hypothetical protein
VLETNDVDIACITETELAATAPTFEVMGYQTFSPLVDPGTKTRVLLLVKTWIATKGNARVRQDLMSCSVPSIFVEIEAHEVNKGGRTARHAGVLVGAAYRVWMDSLGATGKQTEQTHLAEVIDQVERATGLGKNSILLGDFNLDNARGEDKTYHRRDLTNEFADTTASLGLEYLPTRPTWFSDGRFPDSKGDRVQRCSVIDHCYVAGLKARVSLLADATTDHRPLLLVVDPSWVNGLANVPTILKRRNYKAVMPATLEAALEMTWNWSDVHKIKNVNNIHVFIVSGITAALDVVAPLREIRVKTGSNVYLTRKILAFMKERDNARGSKAYRQLKNTASRMVRQDKKNSPTWPGSRGPPTTARCCGN